MRGERSPVSALLQAVYERHRLDLRGAVATYIPELARVDPDQFGIAVAIADGHVYEIGDSRHEFTIQSVSKAFVFGLALQDHGREHLLSRVGVEPTGDPFNAIVLDEAANRPPNPMVNAGAIAVTGLIEGADAAHRWQRIVGGLSAFAGRPLSVDTSVAASEAATGHRNRAMAHLMRGFDMVRPEVDEVLDLYFRQCAVLVSAVDLAMMGATLAAGGRQPVTGQRVLSPSETASVLSVMSSCGMYDASGEWIYRVGLPAKSGVGGGIVAILPGQAAIAVFSPRLDDQGNSVRGNLVCEDLSHDLGMHVFDDRRTTIALRAVYGRDASASRHVRLADDEELLRSRGDEIMVVELQGTLGFAAIERLCRKVASRAHAPIELLIDMRRVIGIEPVAARLLVDLVDRSATCGTTTLLSSLDHSNLAITLDDAFREARSSMPQVLPDLDRSLEYAETSVLARHSTPSVAARVDLADTAVCAGLSGDDLDVLRALLEPVVFAAGDIAGRPGEQSFSAWFVTEGVLLVCADEADGSGPGRRLRTVGAGSTFGEMALVSGAPRSAWVLAQTEVHGLELTPESLDEFAQLRPLGAVRLLRNIASLLGGWLRDADRLRTEVAPKAAG